MSRSQEELLAEIDALRHRVQALEGERERNSGLADKNLRLGQEIEDIKRSDRDLHAQAEIGQALLNSTTNPAILLEADGTIVALSRAAATRLGGAVEDMVGTIIFRFFSPELSEMHKACVQEVFDTGQQVQCQAEQAGRLFDCHICPVFNRQGQVVRAAVFPIDMTEHKLFQETLATERSLLEMVVDNLPEFIFAKDSQGRFLFVNQAVANYFQYASKEDIYGKTDFDIMDQGWARFHAEEEKEILTKNRPMINREYQAPDLAGRVRWYLSTKIPWYDPHGRALGLVGLNYEITERKEAEETLRKAHEELERRVAERTAELRETNEKLRQEIAERAMIEAALRRSEEAERRFHAQLTALLEISIDLSEAEEIDDLCRNAVEQGHRRLAFDRLGIWFTTDQPQVMVGSYAIDEHGRLCDECHVLRVDQREDVQACLHSTRPIAFRTEGLLHDLQGRAVGEGIRIVAAIWDGQKTIGYLSGDNLLTRRELTERDGELLALYASVLGHLCARIRAENAMRESEEQYRTLYETAIVGFWRTRIKDGLFLKCNRTMAGLLGFGDPSEVVNTVSTLAFYSIEQRQDFLEQLAKHGEVNGYETRLHLGDGRDIDTAMSARLYSEQGYIEGVTLDITENKRLQQQLIQSQKLESIGTLAGGIAHDFNNLLAVIIGNASVLSRWPSLPDKVRDALKDIVDAAERGAGLTHQLLAYARGGLQKPAPTDLNHVVKSVLQIFRRATSPQIELVRQLDADLPAIVADPIQIEQVTMNLCLNAVQASTAPSVIAISTYAARLDEQLAVAWKRSPGLYVCLRVEDHGCGMDAATVQRIFEPFFTTKSNGRGMGLSATHGIVESHRGHIEVDSRLGQGTTMTVWLPAASQPAQEPATVAAEVGAMHAPRGSETILFIDDDPAVAKTVERILSPLGYIVITHTDTEEATAFLNSNNEDIELILLDLNMPKHSGIEMYRRIANRCPHAPVILVSGFDQPEVVDKLRQEGAVDFLQKPFSIVNLATVIRRVLDERPTSEGELES
ncbi:MAG: PAS domain S-box protein [Phycisphaerales bacterium]|nr:PAS domain S-box protein [Phycisphaerales bacterium]